jgi:lipoprotein-anchoring transpeptidase ErfK/SrfK
MADLSRRDFLKLGSLALGSFAFRPDERVKLVRVAYPTVSVYKEPKMDAKYVRDHYRDDLIDVYEELTPPEGPAYNPLWYRVWNGYMHSAYLQTVEVQWNETVDDSDIRETGQLAKVTIPYTQSFLNSVTYGWQPVNRLYYSSTHWVTGIEEGPNGKPWYRLRDELQPLDYFVPAEAIRPIPDEELEPISPDLPFEAKRVVVSLKDQTVTAYEDDQVVLHTQVSTGIPNYQGGSNGIPTVTPEGRFNIMSKLPSKHMGNARLTDNLDDYVLLGVPWTSFFTETGVAFHGTYWHSNFGWPMSRGCVNMSYEDAKWLFRWLLPVSKPWDWDKRGFGTQVIVE